MTKPTITMYGADWCGDCRRAKKWFAEADVAVNHVDLIEHPEAVDIVLERNGGVQRIPVIVFGDDTHLTEPSNEALAAKVEELRAAGLLSDDYTTSETGVIENPALGRFELVVDGRLVSWATYTERDGNVTVPHVETMLSERGKGHSSRLLDGLLELLRSSGRTITPLCPHAARHIVDNPAHHDLLS